MGSRIMRETCALACWGSPPAWRQRASAKRFGHQSGEQFQQRPPRMLGTLSKKPLTRMLRSPSRQKISVHCRGLTPLASQTPKSACVHDHRATDAHMCPKQAASPSVDRPALDHCLNFYLVREPGKAMMKAAVLEHQRDQRRHGRRHPMSQSARSSYPDPSLPVRGKDRPPVARMTRRAKSSPC